MSNYESPTITELGSIADFTRGEGSGATTTTSPSLWGRTFTWGVPNELNVASSGNCAHQ